MEEQENVGRPDGDGEKTTMAQPPSGDHPVIEKLKVHYRDNPYVTFGGDTGHSLEFKIQDGPIKEVGVNGCQIDELIVFAKKFIEGLNEKFPCAENTNVLKHLESALFGLAERKKDREARGVEGFNKA